MNNRKNQNSVLVLATLGVYLGLVLGGATPQVLAQAATAKQFNVKDEIEVKDDFDKKPDELNKQNQFVDAVSDLIEDLRELDQAKRFSLNETRQLTVTDLLYHENGRTSSFLALGPISESVCSCFVRAAVKISDSYFRKVSGSSLEDYDGGWPNGVSFELKTDPDNLSLTIRFVAKSHVTANLLLNEIDLVALKTDANSSLKKYLLENTRSLVEGSTVLLIIHLPRAGLDTLLAPGAK